MADWPADWQYIAGGHGRCPWCGTGVRFLAVEDRKSSLLRMAVGSSLQKMAEFSVEAEAANRCVDMITARCPTCLQVVISLMVHNPAASVPASIRLVSPRCAARPPIPKQVPDHIAKDYTEAALVLADSPKASAALSRRCLQAVLREKGNTKKRDLADQIGEVLDTHTLPTYIAEDLDAIRNIGNFAAHPLKSESTGEIVAVEPGEAEWNLEVLDLLFDHYYVQPLSAAARRAALDAKLADAGKPPMKQPPGKP